MTLYKISALFLTFFLIISCGENDPLEEITDPVNPPSQEENENEDENKDENKTIKMFFTLTDDINSEFITKSESIETGHFVYAFQIYRSLATIDEYLPYANGIFDEIDELSFDAEESYKYKIIGTAVRNAYDVLYTDISDNEIIFHAPFNGKVTNSFELSDQTELKLTKGLAKQKNGKEYSSPCIERFYGETEEIFIPYYKDEPVNLPLRRMSFAIEFNFINIPSELTKITLSGDSPEIFIPAETDSILLIYSLEDLSEVWKHEMSYSVSRIINIFYQNELTNSAEIYFIRNGLYLFNLEL